MEEVKRKLLEQGLWENELEDILTSFPKEVIPELEVAKIYDSAYDLGKKYFLGIGCLDYRIERVLDYAKLGEYIVNENEDDKYRALSTGRIVEFEI